MSDINNHNLVTPPPEMEKKQEDLFPSDESEEDSKDFKEKPRSDSMLVATSGDYDLTTEKDNKFIQLGPGKPVSSQAIVNGNKEIDTKDQNKEDIFEDVLEDKSDVNDRNNNKHDVRPAVVYSTPVKDQHSNFEINLEEDTSNDVIEIKVLDAKKVGDGMGAYVSYKVSTKTNIKHFNAAEMFVVRRYSDFLNLHERLVTSHQHLGRIVPLPPEKDVIGMTKMKMSKEDEFATMEFVEKRRAGLERFLTRISQHPHLSKDPSFIEFLQLEGDLPKLASASVFSGAGLAKLFGRVGDSINKMTYTLPESDQWFEDKVEQIDVLENDLRELHASTELMVNHRRDLSQTTNHLSKSIANMGSAEEDLQLSKVLSSLSDVFGKIETIQIEMSNLDFYSLSEIIKDNLLMISNLRTILAERVKVHKHWKDTEAALEKRRMTKTKMEMQKKVERMDVVNSEITQYEEKVKEESARFETISQTMRQEILRLDQLRARELKAVVVHYLEMNAHYQQQLADLWESFIPEMNQIV